MGLRTPHYRWGSRAGSRWSAHWNGISYRGGFHGVLAAAFSGNHFYSTSFSASPRLEAKIVVYAEDAPGKIGAKRKYSELSPEVAKIYSFQFPFQVLEYFGQHEEHFDTADDYIALFNLLLDLSREPQHHSVDLHKVNGESRLKNDGGPAVSERALDQTLAKILKDRWFYVAISNITQRLTFFTPEELVDIVHVLGRLRFKDSQLIEILQGAVMQSLPDLPISCVTKLFALLAEYTIPDSRTGRRQPQFAQFSQHVGSVILGRKDELNRQQLCWILMASATLNAYCSEFVEYARLVIHESRPQLSFRHLVQLAGAVARLQSRHKHACQDVLEALVLQSITSIDRLSEESTYNVVQLLHAASRLRNPPVTFFEDASTFLLKRLHEFTPKQLAGVSQYYAKVSVFDHVLWQECLRIMRDDLGSAYHSAKPHLHFLQAFRQQHYTDKLLKNSISLKALDDYLQQCSLWLVKTRDTIDPDAAAVVARAFYNTRYGSNELYDVLSTICARDLRALTPEALSSTLFILANEGYCTDIVEQAASEVVERLPQFARTELCELIWAYGAVGYSNYQFWKVLSQAMDNKKEALTQGSGFHSHLVASGILELKRLSRVESQQGAHAHGGSFTLDNPFFLSTVSELWHLTYERSLQYQVERFDQERIKWIQLLQKDIVSSTTLNTLARKQGVSGVQVIPLIKIENIIVDLFLPAWNVAILLHEGSQLNRRTGLPRVMATLRSHTLRDLFDMTVINLPAEGSQGPLRPDLRAISTKIADVLSKGPQKINSCIERLLKTPSTTSYADSLLNFNKAKDAEDKSQPKKLVYYSVGNASWSKASPTQPGTPSDKLINTDTAAGASSVYQLFIPKRRSERVPWIKKSEITVSGEFGS